MEKKTNSTDQMLTGSRIIQCHCMGTLWLGPLYGQEEEEETQRAAGSESNKRIPMGGLLPGDDALIAPCPPTHA